MDSKEVLRAKAEGLLSMGEKPRDIAEKIGLNYQAVLAVRKEMEDKRAKAKVLDLSSIDPVAMELIVDKAKQGAPTSVVKKLEVVSEGVKGLHLLDNEFHTTFSKVLTKAEEFLNDDKLTAAQWVSITNALSNAYNNIFNNSGVNVHVDNSTSVSATSLSMMKGAMRG